MGYNRGGKAERENWPDGHRRCTKCDKILPFSEFHALKHSYYGGVNTECKLCKKLRSKGDYTKQSIESRLYNSAKNRAKKYGRIFSIGIEDVVIPDSCPVFGTKFEVGNYQTCATLDRIDNSKGYEKGNICIISGRANRLKGDADVLDLELLLSWMKSIN